MDARRVDLDVVCERDEKVKLLFQRTPFGSTDTPWIYGVWEHGYSGPENKPTYSYYLHGSLAAKAEDLREVFETEERRAKG